MPRSFIRPMLTVAILMFWCCAARAQTASGPATTPAGATASTASATTSPTTGVEVPRIDSVVMSAKQPHETDPAIIWYDNFDTDKAYGESAGGLDDKEAFGRTGKSLADVYDQGGQGKGNRKVFFGDCPFGKNVARKGEKFDEIYWRVYVKHQPGWIGGGEDKLTRATSFTGPNWTQAMIAHVWTSGEALTLDPASGVKDGQVVTTKYNDFDNLHWLGNKPVSAFKFSSPAEGGWWVCVEAYAKLNTPGKKDAENRLWIDGRLEAERKNLDWRGTFAQRGINAVFLEAYWNKGSPVAQTRWLDNFVISTKPIGPVVCPPNPVLLKTAYSGPGKLAYWDVEVATDADGKDVVWKSKLCPAAKATDDKPAGDRVKVDAAAGQFTGSATGKDQLPAGVTCFCRVRQQNDAGQWSAWSRWHQPFVVEK
jgi:hypothetical protein